MRISAFCDLFGVSKKLSFQSEIIPQNDVDGLNIQKIFLKNSLVGHQYVNKHYQLIYLFMLIASMYYVDAMEIISITFI